MMIKPLTSLRLIFAIIVFLSHYKWGGTGDVLFESGYIGVSFFFILSGFILTYSYKDRFDSGTVGVKEFYLARLARIYPLHLLTFAVVVSVPFLLQRSFELLPAMANLTLTQSWFNSSVIHFSVNSPSWSISDELFFYLLFPLLMLHFLKFRGLTRGVILFTVLGAYAAILIYLGGSEDWNYIFYINPLMRFVDFMLGVVLYQLWCRVHTMLEGLSCSISTLLELISISLLVVFIIFSDCVPEAYSAASYYWLPMMLVILLFASLPNGVLSRVLSNKWFVLGGEISFGFYLWHVIILRLVSGVWLKILPDVGSVGAWMQFILTFVAIIAVSAVTYFIYEKPMNRWIKGLLRAK